MARSAVEQAAYPGSIYEIEQVRLIFCVDLEIVYTYVGVFSGQNVYPYSV